MKLLEWPGKFRVLVSREAPPFPPGRGRGRGSLVLGVESDSSDELRALSEPPALYFEPACQSCQVHEWGEYLQELQPFLRGIPFWCVSYS